METKDSLDSLKNSLIYTMSLGSRELYHSNVWAWLINHDYHFIKVFFKDFDESKYNIPEEIDAKREKDHFDVGFALTTKNNTKEFFIIENKIKSFASVDQLKKYTEVLNKRGYTSDTINAVYTGIIDVLSEEQIKSISGACWRFRSYDDIGTDIKKTVMEIKNSRVGIGTEEDRNYLRVLENICEYAETILTMSQTLSKLLLDDKAEKIGDYKFTYDDPKEYKDSLVNLGLYDIYKKIKVAHFSNYVKQSKEFEKLKQLAPEGYVLDTWTGFSNTHPIFDIRFKREVETNKKDKKGNFKKQSIFEIGIQIEDGMYRYACLTMKDDTINTSPENFFNKVAKNSNPKWFIDEFGEVNVAHHGKTIQKPAKNNKYGTYEDKAPNGYIFIYQYSKLDFDNPITYDALLERIYEDLKEATEVIASLKKMNFPFPNWAK